MTGDESYHAHCFTCRTCKRRIEELVFAKTSQGIYCMVSQSIRTYSDEAADGRRHVTTSGLREVVDMQKRSDNERRGRKRSEIRRMAPGKTSFGNKAPPLSRPVPLCLLPLPSPRLAASPLHRHSSHPTRLPFPSIPSD
jgi:hypothetical protein